MPKMPPWIVWVLVITRAHQPTIGMFSSSLLSVIAKRKGVSRHNFFTPSTTYYNMRNRSMIWSNPIERRIHDATDKEVSTSSFLWLIHTTCLCTRCNTYKHFGTQTNILKYNIPGKAQDMDTLLVFCHLQTGAITISWISHPWIRI